MSDPKKTQLGWAQQPPPDAYPQPPQQGYPPPQQGYPPPQPSYPFQGYAQAQDPNQAHQYDQAYAQQDPNYVAPPSYDQRQMYAAAYGQPQQPQYATQQPAYAQSTYNADQAQAYFQQTPYFEQQAEQTRPIPNADATVGVSARVRFIRLTYLHLLFAILAFAGLEYLLMTNELLVTKVSAPFVKFALGGRWNWGVVLAVFMGVSWVADYWASHARSRVMQYAGLGFYVVAEAVIFVPLLAIVQWKTQEILARGGAEPHIIRDSAFVTIGIFTALTLSVLITKKDFSFLRSGLLMASGAALTLIILALSFGFNLGLLFSVGMVLLAGAYILYYTSQVLAHYDPNQHVAAALALFSSVALMFWYVIRIFLRARD